MPELSAKTDGRTMSNAGKSLLAAGLCRIFRQDGYRVAPFKSQNMALNSFITEDGLEMGRAQVMQAEAAGIAPDVRMNPILLKPTTDTGSQVIVNGEVLGDMDARKYFAYKKSLMPMVLEAYNSLAAEYDIIVIEGAGSPAEINLKKDDIVNMGLAKAVGAPVLLAGDIDRGGVFAQLLGTHMLLEPDEQALLKGFIINKFRGDKTILDPGIVMLEERGGVPVVGVIPFMQLDIDDEDSLSPQLSQTNRPPAGKPVEIVVIRLPHLSNFTDFNVFSRIQEADLRYVSKPSALGNPDMIILPGTKNTMADLRWLRETGMAAAINDLRMRGCPIFGVCGGYQMLGRSISDPDQTEEGGSAPGLGFLETETVFSKEKRRTRVSGRIAELPGILKGLGGMEIEGYEIHMGRTSQNTGNPTEKSVGNNTGNPTEKSVGNNTGNPTEITPETPLKKALEITPETPLKKTLEITRETPLKKTLEITQGKPREKPPGFPAEALVMAVSASSKFRGPESNLRTGPPAETYTAHMSTAYSMLPALPEELWKSWRTTKG